MGKIYHIKTLWVTLVQLECVSKIARRKRKLNTCTDMLLDPNAFQCQVLPSCSGSLWIEKHYMYIISKVQFKIIFQICSD